MGLVLRHCWIQPPTLCIGIFHQMDIFFSCIISLHVIDPAEFSALWHEELRNSHPFLQPSKVPRICCPLTIFPEKALAPDSSTLAWKIPWTEEPGRLQSMGSLGVGHDWATSLSFFIFMPWRRKWQPTPVFLPGESQGWGSLVSCHLWGQTRLKRLSSSSSSSKVVQPSRLSNFKTFYHHKKKSHTH